jgi:hypothetical protein
MATQATTRVAPTQDQYFCKNFSERLLPDSFLLMAATTTTAAFATISTATTATTATFAIIAAIFTAVIVHGGWSSFRR